MQGSPGSAPRVRTPRASCPQAAEPRQCLAANKTAQSCFEPLFLGTWGDFLLPAASPCAWRSGVPRAGDSRAGETSAPTRTSFFAGERAKLRPAPGGTSAHPSRPRPRDVCPLAPSPALLRCVLARVSVLPSLPSGFSHRAKTRQLMGGSSVGSPLAQQGGGGG